LSQNFLTSERQARILVDRLHLIPRDNVVEFGAGQGAITFLLAEKVARVLAVEIDAGLATELKEKVAQSGKKNIEVIHEDLLKSDWKDWSRIFNGPFSVIGNLPYHISTPILFKIIENRSIIKTAYVMLQKEVADRLLSQSGTKEYGIITILIGYYAQVRSLVQLKPSSFFPRPKVSSTFIEMVFRQQLTPRLADEDLFRWVVRSSFGQRRKQIKNALIARAPFPSELIVTALEMSSIDPRCRGETLAIEEFVNLSNILAFLISK